MGRALRLGTAPARGVARATLRVRPDLEPRLADLAWLWQPGWGRGTHERLYRTPDPYGLDGNDYEHSKFDLIVDTLRSARYERTLEVGCAEGMLSARLVGLSTEFVGVDLSDAAVARARERLAGHRGAQFERRTLPFDMPEGTFDLIVCSDVLYYWEPTTLRTGVDRLLERLRPGGSLLLLHYLGDFGQANSGDAVHDLATRRGTADPDLVHLVARAIPGAGPGGRGVRLDVLGRTGAVAASSFPGPRAAPAQPDQATLTP